MTNHYLSRLFNPQSVAIVGATDRDGALGRLVWENMRAANFQGTLYAVNPKHSQLFGNPCYARLSALPVVPDLIVVTAPAQAVLEIMRDAGQCGIKAAVVLSAGFGEIGPAGHALAEALKAEIARTGIRMIGPNCLGIMRPAIGLDATFANTAGRPGSLALVSQSGAVCTAILDWAATTEIGFSSLISLGGAIDLDFGEVLNYLVHDPQTRGILLYIEGIRDARRFLSSLRAAARVKPVIVLKAGRHAAGSQAVASHTGALTGSDRVFDAALARSGAVRVTSSLQLFAAARILADPSLARGVRGDRLAIVTNGGGPGVVAADCAIDNGLQLAELSPKTVAALNAVLPAHWSHANPVDLIGDATPQRFTEALQVICAADEVDAVLVLFCPQSVTPAETAASAVIAVAEQTQATRGKPLFTAWLGGASIGQARSLLEAAGIPNFLAPETAVEAFSYLARFRRYQAMLLESVPVSESMQFDEVNQAIAAAWEIRNQAVQENRSLLNEAEAKALLAAFGLPVAKGKIATTREAARLAAEAIGYPVVMKIHAPGITHKSDVGGVRLNLQNGQQVENAFEEMFAHIGQIQPQMPLLGVNIQPMLKFRDAREVLVGLSRDPVFGPVIAFGSGGVAVEAVNDVALALPPLNLPLSTALIEATRVSRVLRAYRNIPAIDHAALQQILLQVSGIACLLPWVKEMDLNPVLAHPAGAAVVDARIVIDADAPMTDSRYRHMAIFPYPVELEQDIQLKDGARLRLRPIRPDDAARERAFVAAMSRTERYYRFLHPVAELSAETIARFTQLDYSREMALVALTLETSTSQPQIAGVARYYPNPDGVSVEFAIAIASDWQTRGLGNLLMRKLIDCARISGYNQIEGTVLKDNLTMLKLAGSLGFTISPSTQDMNTVMVSLQFPP